MARAGSSAGDFDPYHKWLGLPRTQRPPTFYQLLGVAIEEDDADAIRAAATQRQAHVRKYLVGADKHHADSLLFELGEAQYTLLNPKLREAYDRSMISVLERQRRQGDPAAAIALNQMGVVGEESGLWKRLVLIVGIISICLTTMAVGTYYALGYGRANQPTASVEPDKPSVRAAAAAQAPAARGDLFGSGANADSSADSKGDAKKVVASAPDSTASGKSSPPPIAAPAKQDPRNATPEKPPEKKNTPVAQTVSNSLRMPFVLVAAGEFNMGMAPAEREARPKDQPQHPVRITRPFYLGKFEVTRGQFRRFVEEQKYRTQGERDGTGGYGFSGRRPAFVHNRSYTWKNPGFAQTDDHPVVLVGWHDAAAFCTWLSQKESKQYRLPTEAEWEYASRGGSTGRWSHGDSLEDLPSYANTADASLSKRHPNVETTKSLNDEFPYTAPAGSFLANEFGLHDMMGNVFEWCADWGHDGYYRTSPPEDPSGPPTGSKRVMRGGSWFQTATQSRPAFRDMDLPTNSNAFLGFRVVQVILEP